MADITITHTHIDGTLLTGSEKGDGVLEIVRQHGFIWRRTAGIHVPGSRDRLANTYRINAAAQALRDAGHAVTVDVDDTFRPAATRNADRSARVADRVARLEERADRRGTESAARLDASHRITDGIPLGQPVQPVGHHSRAAHLNALDRSDNHHRKAYELSDAAESAAARAQGAAAREAAKTTPGAMYRRRETLMVEARDIERKLAGHTRNFYNNAGEIYTQDVHEPATGEWAERLRHRAAMVAEEIAHLTAELADHDVWGPEHFVKGDLIRTGGRWYQVTRVNKKSVSLAGNDWPRTMTWDNISGRRRDGVQHDAPHGEPWPVTLAVQVSRWAALVRRASVPAGYGPGSDEARTEAARVAATVRIVHGLPADASDAEVRTIADSITGTPERRDLAAACVTVFDRLVAGENPADVATTVTPITGSPVWQMPAGRATETRLAGRAWPYADGQQFVRAGDLIAGMHERYFGGQRIMRHFVGPVATVSAVNDRREAGEFVTITLLDGQDATVKTNVRFEVHPAGTWETAVEVPAAADPQPEPAPPVEVEASDEAPTPTPITCRRLVARRVPEVGSAVYDADTGEKVSPAGNAWWSNLRRARQELAALVAADAATARTDTAASATALVPDGPRPESYTIAARSTLPGQPYTVLVTVERFDLAAGSQPDPDTGEATPSGRDTAEAAAGQPAPFVSDWATIPAGGVR